MKEFETQNRAGSRWKQMIEEQAQKVPLFTLLPSWTPQSLHTPLVLIYDNNGYHNQSLS